MSCNTKGNVIKLWAFHDRMRTRRRPWQEKREKGFTQTSPHHHHFCTLAYFESIISCFLRCSHRRSCKNVLRCQDQWMSVCLCHVTWLERVRSRLFLFSQKIAWKADFFESLNPHLHHPPHFRQIHFCKSFSSTTSSFLKGSVCSVMRRRWSEEDAEDSRKRLMTRDISFVKKSYRASNRRILWTRIHWRRFLVEFLRTLF